jgi:hypothetical protein
MACCDGDEEGDKGKIEMGKDGSGKEIV